MKNQKWSVGDEMVTKLVNPQGEVGSVTYSLPRLTPAMTNCLVPMQEMASRELKRSMLKTSVVYNEEDETDAGSEVGAFAAGSRLRQEHMFHQQVSGPKRYDPILMGGSGLP